MKKQFGLLFLAAMVLLGGTLTSCGDDTPSVDSSVVQEFKVTFYDGDTVLKTETVKNGDKVNAYTPEKEGYTFLGWYGTPNFRFEYDFNNAITDNTSIYAKFQEDSFVRDTRSFYIVGAGTSSVLEESNWGKVCGDNQKLSLADKNGVNEYSITLDLMAGDQFQLAINTSWNNQRGAGYFESLSADGVEYFSIVGSFLTTNTKKSNVEVLVSGNYTITLTTYPNLDTYDEKDEYYTEENRENFNYSDYDKITWVRNGDCKEEAAEVDYNVYIKGQMITGWAELDTPEYTMNYNKENNTFTYSHQFYAGDTFMFYSRLEDGANGPVEIKGQVVDKENCTDKVKYSPYANFEILENGTYSFVYDVEKRLVSISYDPTFDLEYIVNDTWYIVGSGSSELLSQSNYGRIELTEKFQLKPVEGEANTYSITLDLQPGDEFQIVKDSKWALNHGFEYLKETAVNGEEHLKKALGNIGVIKAGNYTLTLHCSDESITKDYITWVRNGDVVSQPVIDVDLYIKTSEKNEWAPALLTTMKNNTSYEFEIDLKEEEMFVFVYQPAGVPITDDHPGNLVRYTAIGTTGEANSCFEARVGDYNFKCIKAGKYLITFDFTSGAPVVNMNYPKELEEAEVIIKGNWTSNWAPSDKMNTVDGVLEFTWTFAKDAEFGLTYWLPSFEGDDAKYGVFMNYSYLGTTGASNSNFVPKNPDNVKSNIVCNVAGTYKVRVDMTGNKAVVDFSLIEEAEVIIKGNWTSNWAPSDKMNTVNGVLEFEWTFAENAEFGLTYWLPSFEGDDAKYGIFMNYSYLGTTGASNSNFTHKNPDNVSSNIVCSVAGTYKVRVDMTGSRAVVDFTLV